MNEALIKSIVLGSASLCINNCYSHPTDDKEKCPDRKPNVILILADDLGYGDLSCYGSPNITTENIDRLAEEGMIFTTFYASMFSAPSRAQLMTGCYPPRIGMARNPVPGSSYGLNSSERTIAELLKIEGYTTMCIGKWHLGDAIDFLPTRQGFDEYFGIPFSNDMWRYHPRMAPSEDEDSLMHAIRTRAAYTGFAGQGTFYPEDGGFQNDLPLMKNERVIETNPDQRFLTSRYTEMALEFIETNQKQPFFLYFAHAMPHVPLFVSPEFDGKSQRGLYGDAVMEIDWSVGQIMEKLHQLSIDTNTLIIFMSDNGPWLSYGIDGGSAGPLRDGKESEYEGGFRVPAIFWLPGQISGGKRNSQITGNMDILPTIASLIGSRLDDDVKIDGVDISSILTGKGCENIDRYFHYFGPSAGGKVNYMGIRDKRWKLLFNVTEAGDFSNFELYDLHNDVSERFNRLEQHPLEAERLKNVASEYFKCLSRSLRPAGKI